MVNLLGFHKYSTLIALLTERMLCNIFVTDSFPCTAISTFTALVSSIFLIVAVHFLCMLLTVPPSHQCRTAWISTRFFRFAWHCYTSFHTDLKTSFLIIAVLLKFSCKHGSHFPHCSRKKALGEFLLSRPRSVVHFRHYHNNIYAYAMLGQSVPTYSGTTKLFNADA